MSYRGQMVDLGGAQETSTIRFFIDSAVSVQSDILDGWLRVDGDFTLGAIEMTAKVEPSASVAFDILRSTDHGSSFSSIIATPFAQMGGVHYTTFTPTWLVTQLSDGDLLQLDTKTGDGAASEIFLTIKRPS